MHSQEYQTTEVRFHVLRLSAQKPNLPNTPSPICSATKSQYGTVSRSHRRKKSLARCPSGREADHLRNRRPQERRRHSVCRLRRRLRSQKSRRPDQIRKAAPKTSLPHPKSHPTSCARSPLRPHRPPLRRSPNLPPGSSSLDNPVPRCSSSLHQRVVLE